MQKKINIKQVLILLFSRVVGGASHETWLIERPFRVQKLRGVLIFY